MKYKDSVVLWEYANIVVVSSKDRPRNFVLPVDTKKIIDWVRIIKKVPLVLSRGTFLLLFSLSFRFASYVYAQRF